MPSVSRFPDDSCWASLHVHIGHLCAFSGENTFLQKVKVPCPRINWFICFSCHWVVGVLYIIYMLIPDQIYDLQIFFPILWVVFSLSWQCPVMYKTFLTLTNSNLFLIVLSLLLVPQPRNCCQIQRHDYPWCFLPRVAVFSSHAMSWPLALSKDNTREGTKLDTSQLPPHWFTPSPSWHAGWAEWVLSPFNGILVDFDNFSAVPSKEVLQLLRSRISRSSKTPWLLLARTLSRNQPAWGCSQRQGWFSFLGLCGGQSD